MFSESKIDADQNTEADKSVFEEVDLEVWKEEFLLRVLVADEDRDRLSEFIDEHVSVGRYRDRRIVFVDEDHSQRDEKIGWRGRPPAGEMEYLVSDPKIKGVFIEYFAPELKRNARRSWWVDAARVYTTEPVELEKAKKLTRRVFAFSYLERLCGKYGKDVYLGDIAESPKYMVSRNHLYAYGLVAAAIPLTFMADYGRAAMSCSLGLWSYTYDVFSLGAISREEMDSWEDFAFDLENARRVFLAEAVDKVVDYLGDNDDDEEIMFVYPRLHNERVKKFLEKPPKWKVVLYRVLYPWLNFKTRVFRRNEEHLAENREYSGWEKAAEL